MKYVYSSESEAEVVTKDFRTLLLPSLKAHLESSPGEKFIDLGCGSGRVTTFLAAEGLQATGIDRSANQISRALTRSKRLGVDVDFFLGDITRLPSYAASFDHALLAHVLLDCRSKDEFVAVICGAISTIKSGGMLIIYDLHPHNIERNSETERVSFIDDNSYFDLFSKKRSLAATECGKFVEFNPNFHFTLQLLFQSLISNNCTVDDFLELTIESRFPTHFFLSARRI